MVPQDPSGHGQGDHIRLRHGVAIGRDIGQPHDRHYDRFFGEKYQQRLDVSRMIPFCMKICMKKRRSKSSKALERRCFRNEEDAKQDEGTNLKERSENGPNSLVGLMASIKDITGR